MMNFSGSPPVAAKSTLEGTIKANTGTLLFINKIVLSGPIGTLKIIGLPIYIRPLTGQIFPRAY